MGLSPHTRGNPLARIEVSPHTGSIPAHAGEPQSFQWTTHSKWVYPRTRGGTIRSWAAKPAAVGLSPHTRGTSAMRRRRAHVQGLSPHTRGNPRSVVCCQGRKRSIPAHAGEPIDRHQTRRHIAVYPCTRGGTSRNASPIQSFRGLSPHTRGNPPLIAPPAIPLGSIPAHAGEPWSCRAQSP